MVISMDRPNVALPEGPLVAPSILGCDHGSLAQASRDLVRAGADMIHLDVMDGVFVPVLTFGAGVARSIAESVDVPVDAHLMVQRPARLVKSFARAGCDFITVHAEVDPHLDRLLASIRDHGCRAGLALNPATPPESLEWVAPLLDLVLVMTVNPGFGGQRHLDYVRPKIPRIRKILDCCGRSACLIAVDGGVDSSNASDLRAAGADILVSGSFITGSDDPANAIERLR